MYNANPAVIKARLLGMEKDEFMRHARYINLQRQLLPEGNRKRMFVGLFVWCQHHYRRKWG